MIAGFYLVFAAGFCFWFGSIVDHNAKKTAMPGSNLVSALFYLASLVILPLDPEGAFSDPYGPYLWCFVLLVMLGG
ncbi:MAG: hypothetical protein MO852_04645 [Candidatus Devosia euplotis]|nr:hypothetical protein [Candidatus Devosia euplotis]